MADEKETKAEQESEKEPKKSKKLLFIIIAAVLVLGGAGAGYFMLSGTDASSEAEVAAEEAAETSDRAKLVALDTFLVNLNDPQGDRYLKLTMRLAIAPEPAADKVSEDDLARARLRDRILNVLMRKTFAELSNPLGKEGLRLEIETEVNDLLAEGTVQDVLFSEFVAQ